MNTISRIQKAAQIFSFFIVLLFSMVVNAQSELSTSFDHQAWSSLLNKHVSLLRDNKASEVSYQGFKADDVLLQQYLDTLSAVDQSAFDTWSEDERLAFLINAYNAWTVKLIVNNLGKIDSIKDIGGLFSSPWKKSFIPLFGEKVSLDHIEHTLIRGEGNFNEPRIHFAVNCASIGCPSLSNEAFFAATLDEQLESQTVNFFRDEQRNYVKGNTLNISPILKWYRKDFEKGWGGSDSLSEFLGRYSTALVLSDEQIAKLKAKDMKIKFTEYDWNLNGK